MMIPGGMIVLYTWTVQVLLPDFEYFQGISDHSSQGCLSTSSGMPGDRVSNSA